MTERKTLKQLREELAGEMTDAERAEKWGGHPNVYASARTALRKMGYLEARKGITNEEAWDRIKLCRQGLSFTAVARRLGRGQDAIRAYWDRYATDEDRLERDRSLGKVR